MPVSYSLGWDQSPPPIPVPLAGTVPHPLIGWSTPKDLSGNSLLPGGYTNPDAHYHGPDTATIAVPLWVPLDFPDSQWTQEVKGVAQCLVEREEANRHLCPHTI